MATIMEIGNYDPTVFNGGIINSYSKNNRYGRSNWMIVEAETFEAIDEMFEPIRAMSDAVINPVMALPAS